MHVTGVFRTAFLVAALMATMLALAAGPANAGEFRLATCQADRMNYSMDAFAGRAGGGMTLKRACNPEGTGLRGMITTNIVRKTAIPHGSASYATIDAPPGTRFATLTWAGTFRRRDCRYALQMYAYAADVKTIPIKNVRANQNCPRGTAAQAAGYRSRTFNISGATRVVQRVVCMGNRKWRNCSGRSSNYIRSYKAEVRIIDDTLPGAGIFGDTPLARGEWVRGRVPLNYDASDNVGVRNAQAIVAGQPRGRHDRPCALATPDGAFAVGVPCPNGPGAIDVDTTGLPEGSQTLLVQAQDTAGNLGNSAPLVARIDNTPPTRVDVAVEGGEEWRNQNNFAVAWVNPPEPDRAPIVAANTKLCAVGGACTAGEQPGADISRFGVQVPAPGEWTVSTWRRDAAGNQTEDAASVPVTLRYDPEPPKLTFDPVLPDDPTLVSVPVVDTVSGLAGGAIEISAAGSSTWQTLPTQQEGSKLVARIDDAALPAGNYVLRAAAHDKANNQASTELRADGQPAAVTLPLRNVSVMQAGVPHVRTVRRKVMRDGKRRSVRRRVTEMRSKARVEVGRHVEMTGRLVNAADQGIAGLEVQVLSASETAPEAVAAVLQTDAEGRYTYRAAGDMSRTFRFVYAGSSTVLPASAEVKTMVPAASSMKVDKRRVLNGKSVVFDGKVRSLPIPAAGKLVELQVYLSERWQTFRTTLADAEGNWSVRYRFKRTRGVQRFHFRARLPKEAGYPFGHGVSPTRSVRVRGV